MFCKRLICMTLIKYPRILKGLGSFSFLIAGLVGFEESAVAQAYIPSDGSQVVETLRKDLWQSELSGLRKKVTAAPTDSAAATRLATRYIEVARKSGDPRNLGYAESVLKPWRVNGTATADMLVLQATILQSTHQFPAALLVLNQALKLDRHHAQAWLTKATIELVMGNYSAAKSSCLRLQGLTTPSIATACFCSVASLNGDAGKSYLTLQQVYNSAPEIDIGLRSWLLTLLGEMAVRLGDNKAAENWFVKGLRVDPNDHYLLGAYADLLLDQERDREVITLLADKNQIDGLLLRSVIALQKQKSPLLMEKINTLQQRFGAAASRGDTVHQREQARFELQLKQNPNTAMDFAEKNWSIQKEPADLKIVLEAAWASQRVSAASPMLEWMRQNKLEDARLHKVLAQLGGSQR
jgi:tetratricopeptide (TPR) repeat protein